MRREAAAGAASRGRSGSPGSAAGRERADGEDETEDECEERGAADGRLRPDRGGEIIDELTRSNITMARIDRRGYTLLITAVTEPRLPLSVEFVEREAERDLYGLIVGDTALIGVQQRGHGVPIGFRCWGILDRRHAGIGADGSTDPWFTTFFPSGRAVEYPSGSLRCA